jgi:protein lysine acetyltransferase
MIRPVVRRTAAEEALYRQLLMLTEELHALDTDIAAARAAAERGQRGQISLRHDSPPHLRLSGERVRLRDGAEILIRPIEPDDAEELERGLEHLSAVSAYRRFRTQVEHLGEVELDYLTRLDHCRHEALTALSAPDREGIGVARYVCDPADPAQAEVMYVVADAWQERGVGSALIERLAARARASGVQRFVAKMIPGDTRARRLLERVATPIGERDTGGIVEITAQLREPRA